MKINPYLIIFFLLIYIPSEDFLLKWLPVSEYIYSLSRFISEFIIYFLFLLVILNKFKMNRSLKKTPIDIPLLVFIIIGIFSIFYNNAPFLGGIIGLRTLLRYLVVYYILVNINLKKDQLQKSFYLIIIIGVFESLISIYQHFFGTGNFWLPRETNIEIAGYTKKFTILTTGIEQGASIGTLSHSVDLALFLLIQYIILLIIIFSKNFKFKKINLIMYLFLALNFIALLFTYSRGTILMAIIIIPFILILTNRKNLLFFFLSFFIYFSIIFALFSFNLGTSYKKVKKEYTNPVDNIRIIFSKEYWEATEGSRQWVLKEIGGFLLKKGILIGLSPDEFTAREKIAKLSKGELERILYYKAFEDVYWIAILAYFGILGLLVYLYILYKLYKSAKYVMNLTQNKIILLLSQTLLILIIISIPLTFIIRTFEFRVFSYYFWFIAGTVVNEYIKLRKNENTTNK